MSVRTIFRDRTDSLFARAILDRDSHAFCLLAFVYHEEAERMALLWLNCGNKAKQLVDLAFDNIWKQILAGIFDEMNPLPHFWCWFRPTISSMAVFVSGGMCVTRASTQTLALTGAFVAEKAFPSLSPRQRKAIMLLMEGKRPGEVSATQKEVLAIRDETNEALRIIRETIAREIVLAA